VTISLRFFRFWCSWFRNRWSILFWRFWKWTRWWRSNSRYIYTFYSESPFFMNGYLLLYINLNDP